MMRFFYCFFIIAMAACAPLKPAPPIDVSSIVAAQGIDPQSSALLIQRLSDSQRWESHPARADIRFPPASTSKIPHTLIALETGTAEPITEFKWDGQARWAKSWNQDQTLTTAYQRSAVWVYQLIAEQLGSEVMGDWLGKFNYGNSDVGSAQNVQTYWLQGPLAISVAEQVEFLTKLSRREFPLTAQTYEQARVVMLAETGADYALYAKSGWYFDEQATDIGWYVGWVERDGETYVFAFNVDMEDQALVPKRLSTVRAALIEIGALPAEG